MAIPEIDEKMLETKRQAYEYSSKIRKAVEVMLRYPDTEEPYVYVSDGHSDIATRVVEHAGYKVEFRKENEDPTVSFTKDEGVLIITNQRGVLKIIYRSKNNRGSIQFASIPLAYVDEDEVPEFKVSKELLMEKLGEFGQLIDEMVFNEETRIELGTKDAAADERSRFDALLKDF